MDPGDPRIFRTWRIQGGQGIFKFQEPGLFSRVNSFWLFCQCPKFIGFSPDLVDPGGPGDFPNLVDAGGFPNLENLLDPYRFSTCALLFKLNFDFDFRVVVGGIHLNLRFRIVNAIVVCGNSNCS